MFRLTFLVCVLGVASNPCDGGDRDPKGGEGEPCYADGTCDDGLHCQSDVCEPSQAECGNGALDADEECDGAALAGADCVLLGFTGGVLGCTATCALDEGGCDRCGDGIVDSPEACDDGVNNGDYGFCVSDCSGPGEHCGDGVVNGPEACDDGVNDGDPCRSDCGQDLRSCGDGVLDSGEACDDGALNSNAVSGACRLDCLPATCGDAVVDPSEVCDGTRMSGQTCESLGSGLLGGDLGCLTDCSGFDDSGCIAPTLCGNGVLDGNEQCDGSALSASSCSQAQAPLRLTPDGIEHLGAVLAAAVDPPLGPFPIPETTNTWGGSMSTIRMTLCPGGCTATATALPDTAVQFDGQMWVVTVGVQIDLVMDSRIEIDQFGFGLLDVTCGLPLDGWDQPVYVDIGVEPYVADADGTLALRVVDLGGLDLHPVSFSIAGCGIVGEYLNTFLDYANQIFDWMDAILKIELGDVIYDSRLRPHLEGIAPGLLPSCPRCLAPSGYPGGDLGCQVDTCELDRSQCAEPVCGDGVVQGLETCEASSVGGLQCADVGHYTGGTLDCGANCGFDTSACAPPPGCGNGIAETNEQCDGTDLAGASCVGTGWFSGGVMGCRRDCTLDDIGCLP